MKKVNAKSTSAQSKFHLLKDIFKNMGVKSRKESNIGFMLGGDTGIGKTSFVQDMAKLLGLELILVETPHLIEEHIINIPFIVFSGDKEDRKEVSFNNKGDERGEFEVQLAKSDLYRQISEAKKTSDGKYLKSIYDGRKDIITLFEELGGSSTTVPDTITEIRSSYECILFLDEYYRQTSSTIRNMLRSILNGKIGDDTIPDNVYIIYASNLIDEGIGEKLEHEVFRRANFPVPDKEDWFTYLLSKFEKDKHVKLNKVVIEKFHKLLDQEDISHNDLETSIRVSPRRWEQLIIYINSSLPIKASADVEAEAEAKHLITNVKASFISYNTDGTRVQAKIYDKVLKAVTELIKETSDVEVGGGGADSVDWIDTLKHQIEQKIKGGEHRKYIPTLVGLPGTGKTVNITKLSIELNKVIAVVEVNNLAVEDIIGIPIPKGRDKNIQVKFSPPTLYRRIMKQIDDGERDHLKLLEQFFSPEEAKKKEAEFKKEEYKYIIFFDELNRPPSVAVFNAIRRVLLEKSFGPKLSLPEGSIVVAAVNPKGKGTTEFTKHIKDVIDIIPVGVTWARFNSVVVDKLKTNYLKNKDTMSIVRKVFDAFINKFKVRKSETPDTDPHFFLDVSDTFIYMAPRTYTGLLVNVLPAFDETYTEAIELVKDDKPDEAEDMLRDTLYRQFKYTLDDVVGEEGISESPEFEADLKEWFASSPDIPIFVQQVKTENLDAILSRTFDKRDKDLFKDMEFANYIKNVDAHTFKEDLEEFLRKKIKEDLEIIKKKHYPKKTLHGEIIKLEKEEVTKLEFISREVLHALKLHHLSDDKGQDISNNMYEQVKIALRSVIGDFADEKIFNITPDEFGEWQTTINTMIRGLIKEIQ